VFFQFWIGVGLALFLKKKLFARDVGRGAAAAALMFVILMIASSIYIRLYSKFALKAIT
jgi:hypothetical protein